ncbi:Protein of unknown function [Pyronema omphalodes CBS 100304]|uniref:Uncharacterized protein n=1 Tax=Pyronema omphalodes (strain CBS 100304) TaxID=1076935 RepID=U4L825_PYROM|nr:Protein of unknown function [Pyronema omphalodes CBS 100304]
MTKASTHSAEDQAEDVDASYPSDVASDAVSVMSRANELSSCEPINDLPRAVNKESLAALRAARASLARQWWKEKQNMQLHNLKNEMDKITEETLFEQRQETQLLQPDETEDAQIAQLDLDIRRQSRRLPNSRRRPLCSLQDRIKHLQKNQETMQEELTSKLKSLDLKLKSQKEEHKAMVDTLATELEDGKRQMSILCRDLDEVHKGYHETIGQLTEDLKEISSKCDGYRKECAGYHKEIYELKKKLEILEQKIEMRKLADIFGAKKRVDEGTQTGED